MTPTGVHYISAIPGDGYGDAGVGMIAALLHADIPVTWTPLTWGYGGPFRAASVQGPFGNLVHRPLEHDTVILHVPPPAYRLFRDECEGRRVIAMTTWETDRLPADWPAMLNEVDVVVVPTSFNRDVFEASGVRIPIRIVPHAARTTGAPADQPALPVEDRFVFYTIGPWGSRKAMDETVTAYLDAFTGRDDVALVVKTTEYDLKKVALVRRGQFEGPSPKATTTSWTMAELLANRRVAPLVHLIAAHVSPGDIAGLHRRGDCFVSLTRSEGFGLNVFDAALAANPVIVTGWGGQIDYLGHDYPLLVDYDLAAMDADPDDDWVGMIADHRWAVADHDDAVEKLRWVDGHRDEAATIGARLAPVLTAAHSVEALADRLVAALG